jgi:predicted site-specific integrase-resolvase
MTTTQATRILRCTPGVLQRLNKQGKLRMVKGANGRIEWDEHDIYSIAGLDPAGQINVVYARTESLGGSSRPAEERLEEQKARLLQYCQSYGVRVDLVIGEVRRANRIRYKDGSPAGGFSALMGLISERRIRTLIIESRDRICVGSSWEMFEWILKSICGIDIIVLNKVHVTKESREESKFWIADMLQIHKAMVGEIKDKQVLQQFWGGPDVKLAKNAVRKLDEALRQRKRLEHATGQEVRVKKQPVDLDDLF